MSKKNKPGKVLLLPADQIEPSPYQARTQFDDNEIAALAVSILQNGLLQPISVRQVGLRKYQLVAGERRLRACRLAKMQKVPAILADFDDSESAALGLLENIQRTQLDPFDTARGIREVIRLWGCTQAEAARRLGLSQPALANKLRLLTLNQEQQTICTLGRLTERHARAALRLPENRRTEALKKMSDGSLSVREADKLVEEMLAALRQPQPAPAPAPQRKPLPMVKDVRFFVNTLQHAVDVMTEQGIQATTTCGRKDGYLEYTVRIPVEGEGRGGQRVSPPLPVSAAEVAAAMAVGACGGRFAQASQPAAEEQAPAQPEPAALKAQPQAEAGECAAVSSLPQPETPADPPAGSLLRPAALSGIAVGALPEPAAPAPDAPAEAPEAEIDPAAIFKLLAGRDPAPEAFDRMKEEGFVEQDFALHFDLAESPESAPRELRGTLRPVAPPPAELPAALAAAQD